MFYVSLNTLVPVTTNPQCCFFRIMNYQLLRWFISKCNSFAHIIWRISIPLDLLSFILATCITHQGAWLDLFSDSTIRHLIKGTSVNTKIKHHRDGMTSPYSIYNNKLCHANIRNVYRILSYIVISLGPVNKTETVLVQIGNTYFTIGCENFL